MVTCTGVVLFVLVLAVDTGESVVQKSCVSDHRQACTAGAKRVHQTVELLYFSGVVKPYEPAFFAHI